MAFDNEVETCGSIPEPEPMSAASYATALLQNASDGGGRRRRPEAQPVRSVGVIGAGLMAGQLAVLFARRLRVPVLINDLSQARIDSCLAWIETHVGKLQRRGHLDEAEAKDLLGLFRGTLNKGDFRFCDVVIEAVIEDPAVKRTVFTEIEPFLSSDALMLTNTSSLSVESMGGQLVHQKRLTGLHFFNPVAVLPLVEIVRTEQNNEALLERVISLAGLLGKTPVLVTDTPGFVVNRLLTRLLSELLTLVDDGVDVKTVDHALDPVGLPMTPLTLLGFIGPNVQWHILQRMHDAFPGRFALSPSLEAIATSGLRGYLDGSGIVLPEVEALLPSASLGGPRPHTEPKAITSKVLNALAEEVGLILAEGVVDSPAEIDLCMILGANFPLHQGGLTPLLDRTGASKKVWGKNFHPALCFREEPDPVAARI